MARAFQLHEDGSVTALLEKDERELLQFLLTELLELVTPTQQIDHEDAFDQLVSQWEEHPIQAPHDPAEHRLFPDAFRGDTDAATEFRRFTENQLRTQRSQRSEGLLALIKSSGEEIRLSQAEAHECVQTLTDLRLVLGTRLEITDDRDSRGNSVAHSVYDWLTWLQESLVQVLFMLPPHSS